MKPILPTRIREDQVLRRRLEGFQRLQELVPVLCAVDVGDRRDRCVALAKTGESERHDLARARQPRQFFVDVRQNGPVARRANFQDDVGRVLDADDLVADDEGPGAVGGQILVGILRVDGLDEKVLRVGVGGGEAPGDMVVLPEQHDRRSGHRRAFDRKPGRDDAREVPQDRRLDPEMGIVGEDRLAGLGAGAGDDPFVGGAVVDADQRAEAILRRGDFRMDGAAGRQRGDRRAGGGRRIKQPRQVGRHFLRELRAVLFDRVVLAELQAHQLAPDQRVGGLPRLGIVAQDQELRRQPVLMGREERVDAVGIGLKIGLRLGAKRGEAALRQPIKAQGANEPVDPDQVGAGDLGEPSLPGAAQDFHLVEPLARMEVAERPRRIVHRRRENMGDAIGVAIDPRLAGQPRQARRAGVVRHRPVE